jgi:hypothetical protein
MVPNGSPSPASVLQWARLSCAQWLGLSTDAKHRLVNDHYSLYRFTLSSVARAQLVMLMNRFCGNRIGAGVADTSGDAPLPDNYTFTPEEAAVVNNATTAGATPDYLKLVNTFLQGAPSVINNAVAQLSATDRVRLNNENTLAIARLRQTSDQTTDPGTQLALRARENNLLQLQSTLGGSNKPSSAMILLVVLGTVVLVGGVYYLSQRRK